MRNLPLARHQRKIPQHITLHVRIAERDASELHLLNFFWHLHCFLGIHYCGLQLQELEQVADKEAVVVEPGDAAHEILQVALPTAEGLEEHHEAAASMKAQTISIIPSRREMVSRRSTSCRLTSTKRPRNSGARLKVRNSLAKSRAIRTAE